MKFQSKFIHFHWRKCVWKCRQRNGGHVVSASMCECCMFQWGVPVLTQMVYVLLDGPEKVTFLLYCTCRMECVTWCLVSDKPSATWQSYQILSQFYYDHDEEVPSEHPPYYPQVSNIRRTLAGNKIGDHSDVVGAPPVGAAPTTSSFPT